MFKASLPKYIIPLIFLGLTGCVIRQTQFEPIPTTSPEIETPNLETRDVQEPEFASESATPEQQAIVNQLIKILPVTAGQLTANILYNDNRFAFGTLNHTYPETVAGKYWIITQLNNVWELVYYGEIETECILVTEIELPDNLISVCNNLVLNN